MIQKHLHLIPYLFVHVLACYFLPMLVRDTGSAMAVMLLGIPLVCLITALVYGTKNGINLVYPLLVALLFIPSIFIFYNESAWAIRSAMG